jgi:hypothetical protein
MPIQRVTLFRVPDEKNVQLIIDAYKTLEKENQRVCTQLTTTCNDQSLSNTTHSIVLASTERTPAQELSQTYHTNPTTTLIGRQTLHPGNQMWALAQRA